MWTCMLWMALCVHVAMDLCSFILLLGNHPHSVWIYTESVDMNSVPSALMVCAFSNRLLCRCCRFVCDAMFVLKMWGNNFFSVFFLYMCVSINIYISALCIHGTLFRFRAGSFIFFTYSIAYNKNGFLFLLYSRFVSHVKRMFGALCRVYLW